MLPQFVHNRISEIRRAPGISIRYISGKQNPADVATRGESVKELSKNKLWWNGPHWITCKDLWLSLPLNSEIFSSTPCEESVVLCSGSSINSLSSKHLENYYSSWGKRIRIFSLVFRYFHNLLGNVRSGTTFNNVELRRSGETLLIRELQKKYYGKEYKMALHAKLEYLYRSGYSCA